MTIYTARAAYTTIRRLTGADFDAFDELAGSVKTSDTPSGWLNGAVRAAETLDHEAAAEAHELIRRLGRASSEVGA